MQTLPRAPHEFLILHCPVKWREKVSRFFCSIGLHIPWLRKLEAEPTTYGTVFRIEVVCSRCGTRLY